MGSKLSKRTSTSPETPDRIRHFFRRRSSKRGSSVVTVSTSIVPVPTTTTTTITATPTTTTTSIVPVPTTTTTTITATPSTTTTTIAATPSTTTTTIAATPSTTTTTIAAVPSTTTIAATPSTTTTTIAAVPSTTTTTIAAVPSTTTTTIAAVPSTTTTTITVASHTSTSTTSTSVPSTTTTTIAATPPPTITTMTAGSPRSTTTTTTVPPSIPSTSTSSSSSSSSTVSGNYKWKVIQILEVCGKGVMYKVLCWGTPNKDPQDTFTVYLNKLPSVSTANYRKMKKIKRLFNPTQVQQLSNDLTGISFDITLLFLLIKLSCEGMAEFHDAAWNTPGSHLEYQLYAIKDKRNEVSHCEMLMDEVQFLDEAQKLHQLFLDNLSAAQQKYNIDTTELDDEKLKIQTEKNRIISERLGMDELMKHCAPELLKDFLNEAPDHLREIAKEDSYTDPMSFLSGISVHIHVRDIFTEISVVKGRNRGIGKSMKYTDLLTVAQGGPRGPQRPQVVLVEALAGGGKTTLVTLVTAEWQKGGQLRLKGLDQYQLLFRVQCRDSHLTSLSDLLNNLLRPASLKYGSLLPMIIKMCRILIVIDGLDERNSNSGQLVTHLLGHFQQSPNCTFLCTTRPEALQDFLNNVPTTKYNVTQVWLAGIHITLRTHFVCQYFKEILKYTTDPQYQSGAVQSPGDIPDVDDLEKLMEREKEKEHFRLPLNLTILTWLFFFVPDQVNKTTTQTELYHLTHQLCQDKLDHRLAKNEVTKGMAKYLREDKVKEWLTQLYQKMLEALFKDHLTLSKETVHQFRSKCLKLKLPPEELMAAFLSMKATWNAMGRYQEYYQAPHKGFQEHYGAIHIFVSLEEKFKTVPSTNNMISEIMEDTCKTSNVNWSKFQNMLQQVAGLLHFHLDSQDPRLESAAQEVVDLLHKAGVRDEAQWLDILEDIQASDAVLDAIAKYFPKQNIIINVGRVRSYSQLLSHLSPTQVKIDIKGDPNLLVHSLTNHTCSIVVDGDNLPLYAEFLSKIPPAQVEVNVNGDPAPLMQSLNHHTCTMSIREVYMVQYTGILSQIPPASVEVSINGDPTDLLPSLVGHTCKELWLWQHFFHPDHRSPPPDNIMKDLLSRGVEKFGGQLTVPSLPSSITSLYITVNSESQAKLLPALHNLTHLKGLECNVTSKVSVSAVPCPLPEVLASYGESNVRLYVCDVQDDGRTGKLAKILQPPSGYRRIWFPRGSLDMDGWTRLVEELGEEGITVKNRLNGDLAIPFNTSLLYDHLCELDDLAQTKIGCRFTRMEKGDDEDWVQP